MGCIGESTWDFVWLALSWGQAGSELLKWPVHCFLGSNYVKVIGLLLSKMVMLVGLVWVLLAFYITRFFTGTLPPTAVVLHPGPHPRNASSDLQSLGLPQMPTHFPQRPLEGSNHPDESSHSLHT